MRRIFWDTMLLIYLLEQKPDYSDAVVASFTASLKRRDRLITSWLAIGEVLAGIERIGDAQQLETLSEAIESLPFEKVPFDGSCIGSFAHLRAQKVPAADAIHLACAASVDSDFFYTNDRALHRLQVPGVKFIGGLDSGVL